MSKEYILEQEYKRVVPLNQPYSRFPSTKAAEKDWWKDYYRKNPTFIMKAVKFFKSHIHSHA